MTRSSIDVANYFVSLGDYGDFTNLKIQKMVYYAHGWHLALYDQPLFEEKFEAWSYGPVVPELYQAYKKYKDHPVAIAQDFNPSSIGDKIKFLDDIYAKYGYHSAGELCALTHLSATPWHAVYNDDSTNYIINDHLIKAYFIELKDLLHLNKNMSQFYAAETLSKDAGLIETMHVLSDPQDAEGLNEALERSAKGETIKFDWRNAN